MKHKSQVSFEDPSRKINTTLKKYLFNKKTLKLKCEVIPLLGTNQISTQPTTQNQQWNNYSDI